MFDFGLLLARIRDGLFEPEKIWDAYKAESHSWKDTATNFSLPLIVAGGVLSLILGWLFSGSYLLGGGGGFIGFIYTIIMSLIWFGIGGWIASFLAEKFGGQDSFDQAWSALTFASIPGVVGGVLGTLPWFGWLLSIAGFIWSLVLLFQALPKFLDIPQERSVGHFFATLGLSFVALLVTSSILGVIGLSVATGAGSDSLAEIRRDIENNNYSRSVDASQPTTSGSRSRLGSPGSPGGDGGLFGFGREIDYLEQANEDRYTPPIGSRLDADQVETFARYMAAAQRLRKTSQDNLERLGDNNNEPSFGDFFRGVKGMVNATTAEMQAVKSGGGNWAEHEWVKKQLFEAKLHEDLNATTDHNYVLYQEYEEHLRDWL